MLMIVMLSATALAATNTSEYAGLQNQIAQDNQQLMKELREKATSDDLAALDAKITANLDKAYKDMAVQNANTLAAVTEQENRSRFELVCIAGALLLSSAVIEYGRRRVTKTW